MDTIFMNSKASKTSETYSLLMNLSDKIHLKKSDKYIALSNLQHTLYMVKYKKDHTETIKLKYPEQHGMKTLNQQMDHILHQILQTILRKSSKNMNNLLIIF